MSKARASEQPEAPDGKRRGSSSTGVDAGLCVASEPEALADKRRGSSIDATRLQPSRRTRLDRLFARSVSCSPWPTSRPCHTGCVTRKMQTLGNLPSSVDDGSGQGSAGESVHQGLSPTFLCPPFPCPVPFWQANGGKRMTGSPRACVFLRIRLPPLACQPAPPAVCHPVRKQNHYWNSPRIGELG
jgi:hypothetical protein